MSIDEQRHKLIEELNRAKEEQDKKYADAIDRCKAKEKSLLLLLQIISLRYIPIPPDIYQHMNMN